MNKQKFIILSLVLALGGCANLPEYDSLSSALKGEYLLNESAFASIKTGMPINTVHQLFGDKMTVGYTVNSNDKTYQPQTIPNPYRAELVKGPNGSYTVEYYVARVIVPDGTINDTELTPLIFKDGLLVSIGWDAYKALSTTK